MRAAVAERKERKRFDTSPTPDAPRGRSPITGAPVPPGRPKGTPNFLTKTIKEAIELSCQPGQCHPQGLAGWLVERARGGVQDRQIYAGLVAKVIPAQVQASVDGAIVVQLPWLQGRNVGGSVPPTSQSSVIDAQVIDITMEKGGDLRVGDPRPALEAPVPAAPTPHPPIDRQAGGGGE
jgi:hypothetical protein